MLNSTIYCVLSVSLINLQLMGRDTSVLFTTLSPMLWTIPYTAYALKIYLFNEGIRAQKG